jgi:hypothetical protein
MRHRGGAQRPLPVATDAHNGPVGQTGLHPHSAAAAGDAAAAVHHR